MKNVKLKWGIPIFALAAFSMFIIACEKENDPGANLETNGRTSTQRMGQLESQLKSDLDLINRGLIEPAADQVVRDVVANEIKSDPNELSVTLEKLEGLLSGRGINLLSEMQASLLNNGGTNAEVQRLRSIYKSYTFMGKRYYPELLVPFLDEATFNQTLVTNNAPSHISVLQFYEKCCIPAYKLNPTEKVEINTVETMKSLMWFVMLNERNPAGIIVERPDLDPIIFGKCYCHPRVPGYGQPDPGGLYFDCNEGKPPHSSSGHRCGRKLIQNCSGKCPGDIVDNPGSGQNQQD